MIPAPSTIHQFSEVLLCQCIITLSIFQADHDAPDCLKTSKSGRVGAPKRQHFTQIVKIILAHNLTMELSDFMLIIGYSKGVIYMVDVSRNQPVYNISIAAELVGVHPRTLRIYEETGLVIPARTEGNTRLFSNADIEMLQRIRFLIQEMGLNLAGVKLILMVEQRLHIRIEEWCE